MKEKREKRKKLVSKTFNEKRQLENKDNSTKQLNKKKIYVCQVEYKIKSASKEQRLDKNL